ncbi:2-dehydro-3-deoxyphosphogluconate aldolase/(4S)-4-hydroxy-2-oxoglutarate aldolase [Chitinivorax tropicus]|uniref:2-dehydro-3-deoxy-phosphogluconate aldolase n=1 Tax=Chitinivorax tropicus TaxID=714531 RepID=A0A840MCQ7_9PROT|nr:bifunctional 4-hydroxy-2-oxoglutarate aldolase/2-dehydro-3-deoxy-phosphogluconate aldolase [Chitinivorax tropicus]MBB5017094.1 2-dehydro-3-deoxyphosphogluconate aldolase/(4S)-4-hydroxy-2-oxoglutarate aldolase [Chitinivorax tropicus]
MDILSIMRASPVMPVIVVEKIEHAVPLAQALVAGGIRVLEVTLRSAIALDAIRAMRAAVPDAIVGAGTVTNPEELQAAVAAGAQFMVSPGLTDALAAAAQATAIPLLPGVMTPSDLMRARDAGFTRLKLFPAQQAGGVGMLKALGGPFADIVFCPTGGISVTTAPEFLSLPNVACVGGSWLTPKALLENGDWAAITKLAQEAAALRR